MTSLLSAYQVKVMVQGRDNPILQEASLSIEREEFVVILGHNGSGKSTLLKVLSGDLNPSSGQVLLKEKPLQDFSPLEKATTMITLSQRAEDRLFSDLTLAENITLWESRFPQNQRLTNDQVIQLTHKPERFLALLKQPLSALSGGEKQALLLSFALAHPPELLFLDEHTSALDHKASYEIMELTHQAIRSHRITTLMVTHRLEDALRYGDRLIILNEGCMILDQKKDPDLTLEDLRKIMES